MNTEDDGLIAKIVEALPCVNTEDDAIHVKYAELFFFVSMGRGATVAKSVVAARLLNH